MKAATFSAALASTVAVAASGLACTPAALAEVTTTTLGSQAELVDGSVVQGWTVKDLKPSSDAIPHTVHGVLWEATATDTAIAGPVTPVVSNFNARAGNGDTYRVLFGAATTQGVNPATLAEGQQTTGKLYFDVTGAEPDSVVYNAAGTDLLLWVAPPPAPRGSGSNGGSGGYTATPRLPGGSGAATDSSTPSATAPEEESAQPSADTPSNEAAPTGSSGTPLPTGSQGTPLGSSSGTPVAQPGGPAAEALPPAGGSQGTPVGASPAATPATSPSVPTPSAGVAPAPASPAGSQGTPAAATPSTTPIAPPPAA